MTWYEPHNNGIAYPRLLMENYQGKDYLIVEKQVMQTIYIFFGAFRGMKSFSRCALIVVGFPLRSSYWDRVVLPFDAPFFFDFGLTSATCNASLILSTK